MKKIISLFARNYDGDRRVRDEIVHGAEWVVAGEGVATEKVDGTCCLVKDGSLFKRYDAKWGKTPPAGFIPAQDPDPQTGHWPGWLAVGDGPEDQWHREGWNASGDLENGTYELIGPKVQGNIYRLARHSLVRHGETTLPDAPRTFDGIPQYLKESPGIEGIVWWRDHGDPDSDLVKIKARDFGLPWPPKATS